MTYWQFPAPAIDLEFYQSLRDARPGFNQIDAFVISLEERGRAFVVKRGQSARIVCIDGPQIADVCFWNANDYTEHFWNDQTLNREGSHLTTYSRIWSNMPKFRPMMTVIEDTVENVPTHPGSAHHFVWGAHCNPYYWYYALRDPAHPYVTKYNCHYNLCRAVAPFGLSSNDIHDNLNLFQKGFIDSETGREDCSEASDAKEGDYVEFFAEIDVLVAVSVCPNGSGKFHWSVGEQDIRPLGVEIYDTGVDPLRHEDVLGIW